MDFFFFLVLNEAIYPDKASTRVAIVFNIAIILFINLLIIFSIMPIYKCHFEAAAARKRPRLFPYSGVNTSIFFSQLFFAAISIEKRETFCNQTLY